MIITNNNHISTSKNNFETILRTTAEKGRDLSAMITSTSLGSKLMADARVVLDDRSVDSEMVSTLETVFGKIPATYDEIINRIGEVSISSQSLVCNYEIILFISLSPNDCID